MKNTMLVCLNEIQETISRFSFWVGAVGIPLLGYVMMGVATLLGSRQTTQLTSTFTRLFSAPAHQPRIGLVDPAGVVRFWDAFPPPYEFTTYPTEDAALQALREGEISAFATIPADYLHTGQARYVQGKLDITEEGDPKDYLEWLLTASILNDPMKASLVHNPLMKQEMVSLAETPEADMETNVWSYFVPYALGLVFYIITLGTATTMLNSMSKEKSNRVLETLLTSITPQEILGGKILALAALGLFQATFWFGSAFVLSILGAQALPGFLGGVRVPGALVGWSILLFLLGFFFNSSVMAAAGALADTAREASQVSMLVVMPAIVPIMLNTIIIESPNSPLALALSFIPPTAPMTLVMRMAATVVPWWQPVLASLLLLGSDYLLLRAAAGVFQGQRLLAGGKVSIKRLVMAMAGKN